MPTFSILIPTRNRADLVDAALETCVAQESDDLEIVVVDNQSPPDTREVTERRGDPRIRYVRSDRVLSMHDNWELAVEASRGEWITVLPDDDGFVPGLLERCGPLMESGATGISWLDASYTHPGGSGQPGATAPDNFLTVHPWSGRIDEVRCRDEIERFFARDDTPPIPKILNTMVRRDAVERIKAASGRVFVGPAPDFAFCGAFLALEDRYVSVQQPWMVRGVAALSIGTAFERGTETITQEFTDEFGDEEMFARVPLKFRTNNNLVGETLLRLKERIPEHLDGVDLDMAGYFLTTWRDLQELSRHRDVSDGFARWKEAVRARPIAERLAVLRAVGFAEGLHRAEVRVRRAAEGMPAVRRLRGRVRAQVEHRAEFRHVDGAEHGFHDLPSASRWLDREVLPTPE